MKVEAAEQSAGKVRVNVQISSEEFEEALKKGLPPFLAAMGLRISEKTDYDVALKTLADDDSDEELNRVKLDCAVSYLMPRAVEQSGFSPVCNPAIVGSERNEDGSVSFGIEIHPKPEIELSDYTPVTVTVSHPTVTEEEIDQRIDAMAALGAVTQPDIITGKPKKVPAIIDDRWVQKNVNGCNSVAQLRESLREAGMKHKQQELERLVVAKATVQFAERLTAPILDETIEAVTDNMVGELVNQLAQQGLTLQDYVVQRKITIDAMRDDARKQAVANLRQGAVLDAIFRHEGMELTDEEAGNRVLQEQRLHVHRQRDRPAHARNPVAAGQHQGGIRGLIRQSGYVPYQTGPLCQPKSKRPARAGGFPSFRPCFFGRSFLGEWRKRSSGAGSHYRFAFFPLGWSKIQKSLATAPV